MKKQLLTLLLFLSASVTGDSNSQTPHPLRAVAITFDDLPATSVAGGSCNEDALMDLTRRLLSSIVTQQIPATGFVTEGSICDDLREAVLPKILSMWLDAGAQLGNHAFSHFDINNVSLETYEQDIIRGEETTRRLLKQRGASLRYFRHPMLHTGPDQETKQALHTFLAERGYTVAPVTIDNQEWMFGNVYMRAKERGDRSLMGRVAEAYVPFMEEVFAFFEEWSVEVLGYEPPQVLLLHASELNADHFDDLAAMIKRRGYAVVSLEEALQNEAYRHRDGYVGPRGLSWIHRWAVAKGMEVTEEPREPKWLSDLFSSY